MKEQPELFESMVEMLHTLHRVESNVLFRLVADRLAHDTGTVMHSLLGWMTLLEEGSTDRERSLEMQRRIRMECGRLEENLSDILAFLRAKEERAVRFDPTNALRGFWEIMLPYFQAADVPVQLGALDSGYEAQGDEHSFVELIWKLLNEIDGMFNFIQEFAPQSFCLIFVP